MILLAEKAVRLVAPQVLGPQRASVACVQTTRPKYLMFDADRSKPRCVVQFGGQAELERVHEILRRLHGLAPGLVPEPLGFGPFDAGLHVQIQSGLSGAPWFRLQQEHTTTREWMDLLTRAARALDELQSAIAQTPAWVRTISPADELRSQLRTSVAHLPIPEPAIRQITTAAEALEVLGHISATAQHGDFSLNNLLVEDETVHVIDFDEFGLTFMPLHDETGLALSMLAVAPSTVTAKVSDYFAALRTLDGEKRPEIREHERAFVFHHLLWRINMSHGIRRREAVTQWLLDLLVSTAAA